MKLFILIAVTVAFLGCSSADEVKKTKILNFYKCLTCSENPVVMEDYRKCDELKPEKCKKIAEECKSQILEGLTMEERVKAICKNENGESEKIYDCIMSHEGKKDLNDEEKTQMKEFLQCAKKVNKKYCESH